MKSNDNDIGRWWREVGVRFAVVILIQLPEQAMIELNGNWWERARLRS